MANDIVRFVDAISASPTTRLDLNDGTTWTMNAAILAPPPQMLRSVSSNAMTDGGYPSASRYDYRVIELSLLLNAATQDAAGTALQNLARELDRDDNFLKWQPDGTTSPVFFRTWRTAPVSVVDIPAARALYEVTLSIPAEPFALGLLATLGPYTVSNNPAAGSNGAYVDLTGVIGDVAAPVLIQNTSRWATSGFIACRSHDTSSMVWFKQCESMTLGTNTTNPGGAADAAMSGSGTTNYVRCSFATVTDLATRLTWDVAADLTTDAHRLAVRGTYRIFAAVRRSGASAVLTLAAQVGNPSYAVTQGPVATTRATTTRQLVDLGVFNLTPGPAAIGAGGQAIGADGSVASIAVLAGRSGAAETIDFDYLLLGPADESLLSWKTGDIEDTGLDTLIDSPQESIYPISGANPFASTSYINLERAPLGVSGGFPRVCPNVTNRLIMQTGASNFTSDVTSTNVLTFYYHPRYLYVRPATT